MYGLGHVGGAGGGLFEGQQLQVGFLELLGLKRNLEERDVFCWRGDSGWMIKGLALLENGLSHWRIVREREIHMTSCLCLIPEANWRNWDLEALGSLEL